MTVWPTETPYKTSVQLSEDNTLYIVQSKKRVENPAIVDDGVVAKISAK